MGLETSGGMFFCRADVFSGGLKVDCDFCLDASALPWDELFGVMSTLLEAFLSVRALRFLPCGWSTVVAVSSELGKELVDVALCSLGMGILTGSNLIFWFLMVLPLPFSPKAIPPGVRFSRLALLFWAFVTRISGVGVGVGAKSLGGCTSLSLPRALVRSNTGKMSDSMLVLLDRPSCFPLPLPPTSWSATSSSFWIQVGTYRKESNNYVGVTIENSMPKSVQLVWCKGSSWLHA